MASFDLACKNAVLGILAEVRRAGVSGVTRTSLVKYVYLLDVFVAEEEAGQRTWTGLDWTFYHFGPYATALSDCLDWMEQNSLLEKDERSSTEGKEFVVYKASERGDIKPLEALGISVNTISRLNHVIREYAYSLPKLLDYVYFRTSPMASARPQEKLGFDACRRVNYKEDIRPVPLRMPTTHQMTRLRELITAVRKQQQPIEERKLPFAVFDEHYAQALQEGDGAEIGEVTETVVASLEFPHRDEDDRG